MIQSSGRRSTAFLYAASASVARPRRSRADGASPESLEARRIEGKGSFVGAKGGLRFPRLLAQVAEGDVDRGQDVVDLEGSIASTARHVDALGILREQVKPHVGFAESRVGQCVPRVLLQGALESRDRLLDPVLALVPLQVASSLEVEIVGAGHGGATRGQARVPPRDPPRARACRPRPVRPCPAAWPDPPGACPGTGPEAAGGSGRPRGSR